MIQSKARKKKPRRKIRARPEPRIPVVPSPTIEARIDREVTRAAAIAQNLTPGNLFDSGYLVSAIYYHDGLLDRFNAAQTKADPADRIVAQVIRKMPPAIKAVWVKAVGEEFALRCSELTGRKLVVPVVYEPLGHSPNVHPFAIDLFVNEGSPVRSASRGLVVLAEGGWRPLEWFSTSSVRGGNAVIVFDASDSRFYRYAHLESLCVTAGDYVEPGDLIGAVGHTGFNAARKGHGRHLHFEINEFDARTGLVIAIGHGELEATLEAARAIAPPFAFTGAASLESAPSEDPQSDPE